MIRCNFAFRFMWCWLPKYNKRNKLLALVLYHTQSTHVWHPHIVVHSQTLQRTPIDARFWIDKQSKKKSFTVCFPIGTNKHTNKKGTLKKADEKTLIAAC
uniref:Uncharacterized protein n=1 Tax=Entomoneis paludosa TaxID=265537 RepID=A0A7S2YNK3_9STRA|mmetsp:Transcript_40280/g.83880  ORF Transcript_40280/g.83880 Transcript_40280/m.83880 type:complete len:100 (+) Transcript_40280:325-624(+)